MRNYLHTSLLHRVGPISYGSLHGLLLSRRILRGVAQLVVPAKRQGRPDQSGEDPGSNKGSAEGLCPGSGMGPLRGGGPSARCSGRSAVPKKELPSGSDVDPAPGGDTAAGICASGGGPAGAEDAAVAANTAGGTKTTPAGMNPEFVPIAPGPDCMAAVTGAARSGAGACGSSGSKVRDTTGTSGTAGTDGGAGTAGAEGSGAAGTIGSSGKAGSFPIVSLTVGGTASTTPKTGVKTCSVTGPTTAPGTAAN